MRTERVAIVHYWAVHLRGGEKVFCEMARAFPDADLFLLHFRPGVLPPDIEARVVRTSFLHRQPFRSMPYRLLAPLLPRAVESLDLSGYDLVLSSSAGWTHGVEVDAGATHLCYMHSPPRYLWGETAPSAAARAMSALAAPMIHKLRAWDVAASSRVGSFLANSRLTRARIATAYRASSTVVHPPVDTTRFHVTVPRGDYVVAAGELVPYKRFDLAVKACKRLGVRLLVMGDGPDRSRLEALAAGHEVNFLGRVDDETFRSVLAGGRAFVHAGVEDFGITMVEALASGVPVVAADGGGAAEIVAPHVGVLVPRPTATTMADGIAAALATPVDVDSLRARAELFCTERFHIRLRSAAAAAAGVAARPAAGQPRLPERVAS